MGHTAETEGSEVESPTWTGTSVPCDCYSAQSAPLPAEVLGPAEVSASGSLTGGRAAWLSPETS